MRSPIMHSSVALTSLCIGLSAATHAQADDATTVRCLGGYGWVCGSTPLLLDAKEIASLGYHAAVLRENGAVRCWGQNWAGQCDVPADLGLVRQVAVGWNCTFALTMDGNIRGWGYLNGGPLEPPFGYGGYTAVAAGIEHALAIRATGQVVAWGRNLEGQCNVPPLASPAKSVAGGQSHSLSLRTDGGVVAWGSNEYGQISVPPLYGAAMAIAAGDMHSVALRANGAVVCWGANWSGQCNVPPKLGPVTNITAGINATAVLLANGTVRAWGDTPTQLAPVTDARALAMSFEGGPTSLLVIEPNDCTAIEVQRSYQYRTAKRLGPPEGHMAVAFENLPQPRLTENQPRIRIVASGDLGLADERLLYRVEGEAAWTEVWFENASDCAPNGNCGWASASTGNLFDGDLTIEFLATPSVSGAQCPNGFIEVTVEYTAEAESDCNGNRREDVCEIAEGTIADCNGNLWADDCEIARFPELDCDSDGVIDCCQIGGLITDVNRNNRSDTCDVVGGLLPDCNANGVVDVVDLWNPSNDLDGDYLLDDCAPASPDIFADGVVDAADLAIVLVRWGTAYLPADLDRSGDVGAADLSLVLQAWGPVGFCGDGVRDARENCCNCPEDAGCGDGFDCYFGFCVPCEPGQCPQGNDECEMAYGQMPGYGAYGVGVCDGMMIYNAPLNCISSLIDGSPNHGFSMSVISPKIAGSSVAIASMGLLGLLAAPRGLLRRQRQDQRSATTRSNTSL
jgi:hypothetical protein